MVDFPPVDFMIPESAQKIVIDGKFEILSKIGAGGMGTVFLCQQLGFDRVVALKLLQGDELADAESQARFEREAQALAHLKHKNIVALYGYGLHNGTPYIAMERVEGQSLSELLSRNEPMPMARVLTIAKQLCDALNCAHTNGIIHRDLKPNNVIVTVDGGVKLIDFGLAKFSAKSSLKNQALTEAGTAVGSVLYMSPEQCVGDAIDERTDLYALGCVIYHCLTGAPAFGGDHSVAVMHQQVTDSLPRIAERAISDSRLAAMQAVIDISTAKDRAQRYGSAAEMLEDLTRVEANQAVVSPVAPRLHVQAASVRFGRKTIMVLLSTLLGIGISWWCVGTIYDTKRAQDRTELLSLRAQAIEYQLNRIAFSRNRDSVRLRRELSAILVAQANMIPAGSARTAMLDKAVVQFIQYFESVRDSKLPFAARDQIEALDRILSSATWSPEQHRALVCAGLELYLNRLPPAQKDAGLETGYKLLAACVPSDQGPWADLWLNTGLGYASYLNWQTRRAESLTAAVKVGERLEALPLKRLFATSAFSFADQVESLNQKPRESKHQYFQRAYRVFMSYEPIPLYRNRYGHMGSVLYERAAQLNAPAAAQRIETRLNELGLRDEHVWWNGLIDYNRAMMRGDIAQAAVALRTFDQSQEIDHGFFTEVYAVLQGVMGHADEARKWQAEAFLGQSPERPQILRITGSSNAAFLLAACGHGEKAVATIKAMIDLGRPMSTKEEIQELLSSALSIVPLDARSAKALVEPVLKPPLLGFYNTHADVRKTVETVLKAAR